jgi:pimeloyl-ACP methyl ester carboxylesterase
MTTSANSEHTSADASEDRWVALPAGPRICYRVDGPATGIPLVLITGLTLDLTAWPQRLVDGFAAHGFQVVRHDNRDAGRSSMLDTPAPGRLRQLLARPHPDAYDLADMAADTYQLIEQLGLGRVHLVGMSMGGMIAQTLAARHPDRVATLTSISATTGAKRVGQPALSAMLQLAKPPASSVEASIEQHLAMLARIGSKTFPPDEALERAWARTVWERSGADRGGAPKARQIGAIFRSGDRTAELGRITAPALIIHGSADRMVHPSGGRATAHAIPGARHVEITGMGHHLAPGLLDRLVESITDHARTHGAADIPTAIHGSDR